MKTTLENFINQDRHETIQVSNTTFLVDHDARELREQNNTSNRISFDKLQANESGDVTFVFDKLTRNIYKGYMPSHGGLPPMTEQVTLSLNAFAPLDKIEQMWDEVLSKGDDDFYEAFRGRQPGHRTTQQPAPRKGLQGRKRVKGI